MTVVADKPALRAAALALRGSISSEAAADMARTLAMVGPTLAAEAKAGVASAYAAIGDEIQTAPLMTALDAAGFQVALPVTGKRGTPLVFRLWTPRTIMIAGRMNIPEPPADAPVLEPDLLFVPLAAFDRHGHRIGYGAGFYDRSLAGLRAKKPIVAVGVAYAAQEVSVVPHDAYDQKLDFILTERELIRVAD